MFSSLCTFSAPQSRNTRHNFMYRSQGGSAETAEPLCEGRFSPTFLTEGEMETSMQEIFNLTFFSHVCMLSCLSLQVQGLIISQMLRKSVETRDWVNTIEPRNVRAVMKRVVEDTTSIDVQVMVYNIFICVMYSSPLFILCSVYERSLLFYRSVFCMKKE